MSWNVRSVGSSLCAVSLRQRPRRSPRRLRRIVCLVPGSPTRLDTDVRRMHSAKKSGPSASIFSLCRSLPEAFGPACVLLPLVDCECATVKFLQETLLLNAGKFFPTHQLSSALTLTHAVTHAWFFNRTLAANCSLLRLAFCLPVSLILALLEGVVILHLLSAAVLVGVGDRARLSRSCSRSRRRAASSCRSSRECRCCRLCRGFAFAPCQHAF